MENLNKLNKYRIAHPVNGETGDKYNGMFLVDGMAIIASNGLQWDHVSVSKYANTPSWVEMDRIKKMFIGDTAVAMQLHMPSKDNISLCDTCLHIWSPHMEVIPLPPKIMVG